METNTFSVAVSVRTDSSDSYLYLFEGIYSLMTFHGIVNYLLDELRSRLDEEFNSISELQVVVSGALGEEFKGKLEEDLQSAIDHEINSNYGE